MNPQRWWPNLQPAIGPKHTSTLPCGYAVNIDSFWDSQKAIFTLNIIGNTVSGTVLSGVSSYELLFQTHILDAINLSQNWQTTMHDTTHIPL